MFGHEQDVPDFYLYSYHILIEYFGMDGNRENAKAESIIWVGLNWLFSGLEVVGCIQ